MSRDELVDLYSNVQDALEYIRAAAVDVFEMQADLENHIPIEGDQVERLAEKLRALRISFGFVALDIEEQLPLEQAERAALAEDRIAHAACVARREHPAAAE